MFHTGEDQLCSERFFPGGRSVADTPPGQNGTWARGIRCLSTSLL
jgi:hypothetical protein